MTKNLSFIFFILLFTFTFSQNKPDGNETLNLVSILGFDVAQPTNAELIKSGNSPEKGEGGVKIVHLGPKIAFTKRLSFSNGPGVEGDILSHIMITTMWGKKLVNRRINDLKDFCNLLIEFNQKGEKYQIFVGTMDVQSGYSHRNYLIDISELNSNLLAQYVSNLDKPIAANEKPKNEEVVSKTKRNSEDDEAKDIYASSVDFSNPGKYYAIIIGASNYDDANIPDLDSLPIKDALALKKVLVDKYIFEKENIITRTNPTRRDIVLAFSEMAKKITSNDNLLIFYAGHGHYEKDNDIGYWLPVDAEVSNPVNWLYNDQLVADVKKIKSLHTLLISDACFSGSIFKTRSVNMEDASSFIKQKYQLPSRKAITSGTLKTVPNKSVFIKYLLDRLNNNKEKFFTASQLFQSLEQPVSNNSKSLPQFGVIQNVGDEGGDFIFIKR